MEVFEHLFDHRVRRGDLDPRAAGPAGHTAPSVGTAGARVTDVVGRGVERMPGGAAVRRYDDPVEVRSGWVEGPAHRGEGPEQFLWRGRLWKVRAVLAHWVETGPWWQSTGVRAVIGSEDAAPGAAPEAESRGRVPIGDLLTERELWRVEAGRGRLTSEGDPDGGGVFDLSFDWAEGRWTLVGCTD